MPQKAGSATLKMTMIWKSEISQIAINHKKNPGAPSIIEGAPFGMFGMRIFLPQILGITQMQITSVSEIICLICAICGQENKSVICDNKCMFAEREHIMAINTT